MKKTLGIFLGILLLAGCGPTSADQPQPWQQADTSACDGHGKAINFTISPEAHSEDWQSVTCSDGTAWFKVF